MKNSSSILSLLAKKEKWASSKKQNSVWNLKFSIWTVQAEVMYVTQMQIYNSEHFIAFHDRS